jgi:branched-chain amino acid transport system substrate-binding protein
MHLINTLGAQDRRPEVQAFVAAYKRKYNNAVPDGNAALAYDATKLLAIAVERVGPDRQKIRDYLANLPTPYGGVTGPIRFSSDGDPVGKAIVMTRVRQGALVVETNQ